MEKPHIGIQTEHPNDLRKRMDQVLNYGNTADLEALFNEGYDVDQEDFEGRSPLMMCSFKGQKTSVEMLLARGADVNKVFMYQDRLPMTALDAAREGKKHEIVELLVAHGGKTGKELQAALLTEHHD